MPDVGTSSGGGTTVAAPTGGSPPTQGPEAGDAGLAGQIDALLSNMGEAAATLATDHAAGTPESAGAGAPPGTDPVGASTDSPSAGVSPAPGVEEVVTPPAASAPLSPDDVESLSAQIEALVGEVESAREEAAVPPASHAEATAESNVAIDGASEPIESPGEPQATDRKGEADGLEQPVSSPADGPASQVATPMGDTVDLTALDAHLAAAASGMVDSPLPARVEPVAATLPVTRSVERPPAVAPRAVDATSALIDAALAGPSSPATAATKVAEPVTKMRRARPPIMPTLRRLARSATTTARPAGRWVLGMSATTLERCPKVAQQTAGWIGLVTVFFACCMWAIVLFFRSTPAPEAYGVPSSVLEHGEPTPQPRPRPSAHAADEHAADDGHGAKADDHGGGDSHGAGGGGGHGAADAHGGGGGGHGGH